MTGFRYLWEKVLLISVLQTLTGTAEGAVWRAAQGVSYYSNYASVSPVRFVIPSNQRDAAWQFRVTRTPSSCDDKITSIYLQFGSLPAASPMNETFPDKFYLGRSHITQLNVKSDNVSVPHTELFPQAGDWYAVAVIHELDTEITQKGLTVSCEYNFSALLELRDLPPHLHINVNRASQVALTDSHGDGVWVGFTMPTSALAAVLDVRDCSLTACELQLSTFNDETGQPVITNCSSVDNSTCSLILDTPLLGVQHYVRLQLLSPGNATVVISVQTEDCLMDAESTNDTQSCHLESRLDRYRETSDFTSEFVRLHNTTVQENDFQLSNTSFTVVPFTVQRITDIGGTLHVKVAFKKKDVVKDQEVRVCGQVKVNRFPSLSNDLDLCANVTNGLQVNSSSEEEDGSVSSSLYVPYPEEGLWMLALDLQCYNITNGRRNGYQKKQICKGIGLKGEGIYCEVDLQKTDSACNTPACKQQASVCVVLAAPNSEAVNCLNGAQNVTVTVKIESCVEGGCNGQGDCREYIKSTDLVVFSTCICSAGWRGYGCTDGREALSDRTQLVDVLLLTLSNLFFLPAIIVALHRRYYIEAMVYFYNMFFSTFYHACDGDRIEKYVYCMTEYSVLAIGDFLASTCSLWVTLIAMMQIPIDYSSAIQMAGPLALIVGVLLDRHSLWVIAVPACLGLLMVVVSWVIRCCCIKRCFPDKRRYLCMLPGVLFAVIGAVMYAFFETAKNYQYIHSAWHVCLSLCIIFLLPPRRKQKAVTSVNFDDTDSTEGLVLGPNAYTRRMNFEL